ncbi:MAG: dihydroorotate dehydrogenase [Candidatus Wildermuthbacteria bacterium]|nr:dihydroorotate dehydrogenase [Candidatus Wildermuthbacteria bacterium]
MPSSPAEALAEAEKKGNSAGGKLYRPSSASRNAGGEEPSLFDEDGGKLRAMKINLHLSPSSRRCGTRSRRQTSSPGLLNFFNVLISKKKASTLHFVREQKGDIMAVKVKFKISETYMGFDNLLMNAAGTCKKIDEVKELARAPTAAVVVGSITIEQRSGNEGEVFCPFPGLYTLNSLGLPNPGAPYYWQNIPEMVEIAHKAGKPLFVSVAGFTPSEYAVLAKLVLGRGADLVELNLGCPNIWQGNQQKRIASFDPELVRAILQCVQEEIGPEANVAVKLSPFSDPFALGEVAKVIGQSRLVKVVTASNTFPNALVLDGRGKPRITPGGGLAGLGGPAMKPINLGQVRQLRSLLPERIHIIGVGGIERGGDVFDYEKVGVAAVQIATILFERGPRVFEDLLIQLMQARDIAYGV